MKNILVILGTIFAGLIVLVGGCSKAASTPSVTSTTAASEAVTMSPADAYNLIQSNATNSEFVILDVRTPAEFSSGHVSGAVNIDYYATDFKDQITKLDPNKHYLVYCRTGVRSTQAVQIMRDLDFKNLWNLTGGITQWTSNGYKVVK
jgi:rhodanese-related sulfurtransferase